MVSQAPVSNYSHLCDIRDPLIWVSCFLFFLTTRVDNKEMRGMMAYSQIVLLLACKHVRLGWATYDSQFRQQVAASARAPWTKLNPSLMAATVLNRVP